METAAIQLVIEVCRQTRVPCHIVHLSAASALPLLTAARAEGLPLTVETCHHYLHLESAEIPPRQGGYLVLAQKYLPHFSFKRPPKICPLERK